MRVYSQIIVTFALSIAYIHSMQVSILCIWYTLSYTCKFPLHSRTQSVILSVAYRKKEHVPHLGMEKKQLQFIKLIQVINIVNKYSTPHLLISDDQSVFYVID